MRKLLVIAITGILTMMIGLPPDRAWCQEKSQEAATTCDWSQRQMTMKNRRGQTKTDRQQRDQGARAGQFQPDADAQEQDLASQRSLPFEIVWTPLSIGRLTAND